VGRRKEETGKVLDAETKVADRVETLYRDLSPVEESRGDSQGAPFFEIRPSTGWLSLDLRELWAYRELAYFLAWREIKVRYKQTAIGVAWAVLQPVAMMLVFTVFFGKLGNLPSDGVPYPLFAFAALLPWQLFSRTITECSNSLVADQRLITKVYFPRIIIPIATTCSALVDFAISAGLLAALMLFYGYVPGIEVVWLPAFTFLMIVAALGVGFWLSALNVEYRDVRYALPFVNQIWLFVTPVAYSSSLVPERWQLVYGLNPMVGVIEGFRWALLGVGKGPSPILLLSAVIAVALFVGGMIWFHRREQTFVDTLGTGG
jgi:homopolymeric O-antigen transport system permease protein